MRGRPCKPPTPTALDPSHPDYFGIVRYLVENRVEMFKPAFAFHPQVWLDLNGMLLLIGVESLAQLCRRYQADKYDDANRYLWYWLPKRVRRPFDRLMKDALDKVRPSLVVGERTWPARPFAPDGAKRDSNGEFTPFRQATREEVLNYAYRQDGEMDKPKNHQIRTLAVLGDDPAGLNALDAAVRARAEWCEAVNRLRLHLSGVDLPEPYRADVLAVLDSIAGPAPATSRPTPTQKSPATKEQKQK